MLDLMWSIWPELPAYGRKAAQFVDLLGYFSLKTAQTEKKLKEYSQKAVEILRTQNHILTNHPNSNIYNTLSGLVEFDGYYLESDPCLVCNNPEVPFCVSHVLGRAVLRFSVPLAPISEDWLLLLGLLSRSCCLALWKVA